MLESLFILIIAIAFVLFLLGIDRESKVFCMISLILWIVIFVQAFFIEVPTDTDYTDYTISAISLIFMFANIIYIIVLQFNWRRNVV